MWGISHCNVWMYDHNVSGLNGVSISGHDATEDPFEAKYRILIWCRELSSSPGHIRSKATLQPTPGWLSAFDLACFCNDRVFACTASFGAGLWLLLHLRCQKKKNCISGNCTRPDECISPFCLPFWKWRLMYSFVGDVRIRWRGTCEGLCLHDGALCFGLSEKLHSAPTHQGLPPAVLAVRCANHVVELKPGVAACALKVASQISSGLRRKKSVTPLCIRHTQRPCRFKEVSDL